MTEQIGTNFILVTPKLDKKGFEKAGEQAAGEVGDGIDRGAQGLFSKAKGAGREVTRGMAQGVGIGITQDLAASATAFVGEIVSMGASLERARNKNAIVFGEMIDDVNEWADQSAAAMGLSRLEAVTMAAGIQDLVVPMEFTRERATELTLQVADLSGALAEWDQQGRSSAEVGEILSKALLGERDALVSLGVKISEADVQQRLLEMGMKDATGTALERAKAEATLELLYAKSTDAVASYEAGLNETTRAQNEAQAAAQEAKEQLATELQPVILLATQAGAEMAKGLADLTGFLIENKDVVIAVTAALGAYKIATGVSGALAGVNGLAGGVRNLTTNLKTSLASINPWAVGIGAAVGIATVAIMRHRQQQQRVREQIAQVNTALRDQNGILTSLAEGWTEYALAESEWAENSQLDDLGRVGLTVGDLDDMLRNGEQGIREYTQALLDQEEITLAVGVTVDDIVESFGHLSDTQGRLRYGADDVAHGNINLLDSFEEQQKTIARSIEAELEKIAVDEAHSDAIRATAAELSNADLSAHHLVQRYEDELVPALTAAADEEEALEASGIDANAALEDQEEQAEDTATELEKLADSATTVEKAIDNARKAIQQLNNSQVDVDEATLELRSQFDRLTESLAEEAAGFDISTEAGRDNLEQARDTAEAIRDLELANLANGVSAEEAAAGADFLKASLRRQLEEAGLADEAIDALKEEVPELFGAAKKQTTTKKAAKRGATSTSSKKGTGSDEKELSATDKLVAQHRGQRDNDDD